MDLYKSHQELSRNLKRALDLLEKAEWEGKPSSCVDVPAACPLCQRTQGSGHDADCELGRFLHPL